MTCPYLFPRICILILLVDAGLCFAQERVPLLARVSDPYPIVASVTTARPLDELLLTNINGTVTVKDGKGQTYFSVKASSSAVFAVGGALGRHTVLLTDRKGTRELFTFAVDATTRIDDGGKYTSMFDLFERSMQTDTGSVRWNGKKYRYFVPWGLDHFHTMKGLQYFYDFGTEFVDLMREAQRDDGMIWSFVEHMSNMDYFRTRDARTGYTQKIKDKYFVRQPTENHPEYIFVETIYQCWKATGNKEWMIKNLDAAARALNYSVTDPARWSERFKLLKRVYTIDSWDFQVEDEYLPDLGMTNTMIIDPKKSKFGIFFGDNIAYVAACRELAEMYGEAGQATDADKFRTRADDMEKRLNDLSWNGNFYTHFIEEDPTVVRKLGVDEKSQLAQSNAYVLNLGVARDKSRSITETYLKLKSNLPEGSPGEWYAIYPPFEKGFDLHGAKWQYMNAGVGGHVAGELSRGAFENGYERYAVDILDRMYALGKKYNDKIYFSYTGSILPPPPPPQFTTIDLRPVANMDTWNTGGKGSLSWMEVTRAGDDLRELPAGSQIFANVRFDVIDPEKSNRKAVVAVAKRKGYPSAVEVPVNSTARSIYFLHTSGKPTSENVSGSIAIVYTDNSQATRYMIMGKQLTYWWFSELKTTHSGIAWYGSNDVSKGIGLSWCAIDNPYPEKKIAKIILQSAEDETIYTVLAISLSDQKHYVPVNPVSFGGPDNWAAATNMAALVEGLCGVKDAPSTEGYTEPRLSPRWNLTSTDTVQVTIRYAASDGYVAYRYINDATHRKINVQATGNASVVRYHLLLPEGVAKATRVVVNGSAVGFENSMVGSSAYVDFVEKGGRVMEVEVGY